VLPTNVELTIEAFLIPNMQDSDYLRSFARPVAELDPNEPKLATASRLAVRVGRYTVQTRTQEGAPPGAI